ncbi:MAG: hypothetical protein AAB152_08065 [Candidatus Coatesbacteria bacterium]
MRTYRRLTGVLLVILTVAAEGDAGAAEKGFVPVLQADLRGAVAAVRHGKTTGGAVGSVLVLPAYRLASGDTILPIYIFDGSLYDKVVEEAIFYQMKQVHALSLGYKHRFGAALSGKVAAEGAYAFTRESRNENFRKGLYNYRDVGGRAVVSLDRRDGDRPAPLSVSLRGYDRRYPNYASLAARGQALLEKTNPAAVTAIAGREKKPKDYQGAELSLDAVQWLGEKIRAQASYDVGARRYRDRYPRTDQGLISDRKRFDQMHRLSAGVAAGFGDFVIGLDAGGLLNLSNDSIYDPAQVLHAFLPHYFQFWSVSVSPSILWALPVARALKPRVRLSVGGLVRGYPYRFRQDSGGAYLDGKQRDQEMSVDLRGWYPFVKWLSATAGMSVRVDRSNNKFEQFLKNNYELFVVNAGVTITY